MSSQTDRVIHAVTALSLCLIACAPSTPSFRQAVMTGTADRLSAQTPPPSWQATPAPFSGQQLDEMAVVDDHSVLMGLSGGPYMRLDVRNGATIWRYGRKGETNEYRIVAVQPVILIARTEEEEIAFEALDVETGKRLWKSTSDPVSRMAMTPDGSALVFLAPHRSGLRIRYVDVRTGSEQWRRDLERHADELPRLVVTPRQVLVLGSAVEALGRADGEQIWRRPHLGPVPATSFPIHQDGLVFVPIESGELARLDSKGNATWRTSLPARPGPMLLDGDVLFVTTIADDGRTTARLLALSPETGRILWNRPLGRRIMSNLLRVRGKLAFTAFEERSTRNWLELRDLATGSRLHQTPLAVIGPRRLPDRLVAVQEHVVLAQEGAVSAYSLDGRELWSFRPQWALSHAIARTRLERHLTHLARALAFLDGKDPKEVQPPPVFEARDQSSFVRAAERHQASVYASTRPVLASGSRATRMERRQALEERVMATGSVIQSMRVNQAMERMQANIALQAATWQLMFAMLQAPHVERAKTEQAAVDRLLVTLAGQRAAHEASIQGPYYIRPIVHRAWKGADDPVAREKWWGFLVVDLRTGRWAEAVVGVPASFVMSFDKYDYDAYVDASNQLPTLSGDGSRVVLRGMGLDTTRWKARATEDTVTAEASLLGVDLSDLEFRDPADYAEITRWGYIDRSGDFAIDGVFDVAGTFAEKRALVGFAERKGFVDTRGRYVVPLRYEEARPFSEGVALVREGESWSFADAEGRDAVGGRSFERADDFSGGLAPVCVEERCGFIDLDGNLVIDARFNYVFAFSEGLAAARPAGAGPAFGFIDEAGRLVIDPTLRSASTYDGVRSRWPFRDGRATYRAENGKLGFIDRTGKVVVPAVYDAVWPFSEGRARVGIGGTSKRHYGFVDRSGEIVIPAEYQAAADFSEGLAAVRRGSNTWGFIDRSGKVVIDFQYQAASSFSEGLAAVALTQEQLKERFQVRSVLGGRVFGYVDRRGKFVIPPRYRSAGPFSDGLAPARPLEQPLVPIR